MVGCGAVRSTSYQQGPQKLCHLFIRNCRPEMPEFVDRKGEGGKHLHLFSPLKNNFSLNLNQRRYRSHLANRLEWSTLAGNVGFFLLAHRVFCSVRAEGREGKDSPHPPGRMVQPPPPARAGELSCSEGLAEPGVGGVCTPSGAQAKVWLWQCRNAVEGIRALRNKRHWHLKKCCISAKDWVSRGIIGGFVTVNE